MWKNYIKSSFIIDALQVLLRRSAEGEEMGEKCRTYEDEK
jgi:hypothetical protein